MKLFGFYAIHITTGDLHKFARSGCQSRPLLNVFVVSILESPFPEGLLWKIIMVILKSLRKTENYTPQLNTASENEPMDVEVENDLDIPMDVDEGIN